MIEKHYTLPDAAELLSISTVSLRRYIAQGVIDAVKIGGRWRIAESQLRRIMQ